MSEAVERLAEVLRRAERLVFFGGAGVSTASGIPDFRSAAGLYATASGPRPPEWMLSHESLLTEPEAFWDFHRTYLIHPEARPNGAHTALAELERRGVLTAVVTQNVDGLHQLAGSQRVLELHGSVLRNHCMGCGARYDVDFVLAAAPGAPRCSACDGIVRPDVVLYGEGLPSDVLEAAILAVADADALIVGGTSLNVYPAAGLLDYFAGSDLVLMNLTPTGYDSWASLVVREPIAGALTDAVALSA